MIFGFSVEGGLDFFPPVTGSAAGEDGNPAMCTIRVCNRLFQVTLQPSPRILVFGKDEKTAFIPFGRFSRGEVRTHMILNPLNDPVNTLICPVAAYLCDTNHLVNHGKLLRQCDSRILPAAVRGCCGRFDHPVLKTRLWIVRFLSMIIVVPTVQFSIFQLVTPIKVILLPGSEPFNVPLIGF